MSGADFTCIFLVVVEVLAIQGAIFVADQAILGDDGQLIQSEFFTSLDGFYIRLQAVQANWRFAR